MNIIQLKALIKNDLRGNILHRNFRLDMFASQVMGKNIKDMGYAHLEDLFDAVMDNKETDEALLEILYK